MDEHKPHRDTTYDGVIPEKLWIGVSNCKADKKIHVTIELNGIEKSIYSATPSHLDPSEGVVSHYANLTWILEKQKTEIERLKSCLDACELKRLKLWSALRVVRYGVVGHFGNGELLTEIDQALLEDEK